MFSFERKQAQKCRNIWEFYSKQQTNQSIASFGNGTKKSDQTSWGEDYVMWNSEIREKSVKISMNNDLNISKIKFICFTGQGEIPLSQITRNLKK